MNADASPEPAPWPLLVAGGMAAVEGLAYLGYGVRELTALAAGRVVMGVTTAAFLIGYGAFLVLLGRLLVRRRSWARSPVVLAQLIQLGVAWGFAGGSTVWVAVLLAVSAVVALVGVFHPASLAALEEPDAG